MRKNKMLRMASALLMLVLLTTSVVGGTFAKYVTTADASDTARVAKWGVTITATGTTFAASYKNDDAIGTTISAQAGTSVEAGDKTTHVVAPGTTGTLASAAIAGKPEVAVRVTYEPTLTLTGWKVNGASGEEEYCPLVFKVTKGDVTATYGINGIKTRDGKDPSVKCNDIDDLITKVKAAIGDFSKDYEPNTDLSTATAQSGTNGVHVSWEWAFDSNNDSKDTALGNATTAATVKLEIVTTATQID